jgi:murein DD-endopeptidase MepM/ murein hydrolase activator NlpD
MLWEERGWQPWSVYNSGNLGSEAAATRAVDKVLGKQKPKVRTVLASDGMGGKGCEDGTVTVGVVDGKRVWPVPGSKVELNGYNESAGHGGLDINSHDLDDLGDPIVAAESGVVECAGDEEECHGYSGKTITIDTVTGVRNLYTHLRDTPTLSPGQKVRVGQVIGYVGSTGNSSAPHLHFEHDMDSSDYYSALEWLPKPSTYPGDLGTAA